MSESDKLVYTKAYETTEDNMDTEKGFARDPTMPRINIDCPECHWKEAVYFLTAARGESNLKVILMCTGNDVFECCHEWEMDNNIPMPRPDHTPPL